MKNYRINLLSIFIALTFITLQSCEKKELIQEINQQEKSTVEIKPVNLSDIEFINGILVFDNLEEYEGLMSNNEISSIDLKNWQQKLGFESQQSILEQALLEEEKYFEQFDPTSMTEEERAKVVKNKEAMGYTEFTKNYIAMGIIEPYINKDISSLKLKVNSWVNENFINIDGMVKIGNIIYQFTPTLCKKLTDGDFKKIELMKITQTDNEDLKIIIGKLVETDKDYYGELAYEKRDNGSHYNDEMIEAWIKLKRWDYATDKDYYYYISYENYKKNIWGTWKQDPTADTFYYMLAGSTWNGGSKPGYISYTDTDLWANNRPVIILNFIPLNTNVTFTVSYSWFKRNLVVGIDDLLHPPVIK